MNVKNITIDLSSIEWPKSRLLQGQAQGLPVRGLSKCEVVQISQNMLMRGLW